MSDELEFDVPATTAHLGPGFGVLGLALDLRFRITARQTGVDGWVVERPGEAPSAALGLRHDSILRSLRAARDRWNIVIPDGLAISVAGDVPRGCGLGSNSADFAAGVGLALRFAAETPRTGDLLALMVELGSDPGHGAAALTGGLAVAIHDVLEPRRAQGFRVLREEIDESWRLVIAAPKLRTSTSDAHRVVPATLPHGVVSRTSGRLAGLMRALATGDEELLGYCLIDESHIPYRLQATPRLATAMAAARAAGAAGATISGHGPALIALTTDDSLCPAIAAAFEQAFARDEVAISTHLCRTGAVGALP